MAEPRHQIPATAGHGRLRASHADREQVIGVLKAAFVQGMLAKDEFSLRMGQAFTSRTCAELAALTTDLPPGLTAARPPQPAREPGEPRIPHSGVVLAVAGEVPCTSQVCPFHCTKLVPGAMTSVPAGSFA